MTKGIFDRFEPHVRFAPYLPPRPEMSVLAAWLDRQKQRVHLSRLDDRLLDDIAVSRRAAAEEVKRWD